MALLGCVREEDELPAGTVLPDVSGGVAKLSLEHVLGTWYATDLHARGAVELRLTETDEGLSVQVFGASSGDPIDWGQVRATAYGAGVTADTAMAFTAVFDFDFLTASLAAYVKQGILVLDIFTKFTDGSGRADYFSREFFHR